MNLQKDRAYRYCSDRDWHFIALEETPPGKYSVKLIEDVYYRHERWMIEDL